MAKLDVMPQKDVIDAFRGKIDFYRWCGLVIARSWPRGDYRFRSEAVKASQVPFAYINKAFSALPGPVRDLYAPLATHKGLTSKDWATRLYINGYNNVREHPEPVPEQGLGDEPMNPVFFEPDICKVWRAAIAADTGWTDVALAAHLPSDARAAIARSYVQTNMSAGANRQHRIQLRRKGGATALDVMQYFDGNAQAWAMTNDVIVPVDSARIIQYQVFFQPVPGFIGLFQLNLVGYFV